MAVQSQSGAAHASPFAVDLSGRGVLSLVGPDARRFANGMFTQNLRALPVGAAARTAWCDDRGRVLGLADVYATGADALWMVLDGTSFEAFEERFAKYIVFDDVTLTDHTAATGVLTVQGEGAAEALAAAGIDAPVDGWVGEPPRGVGRRARGAGPGFDLFISRKDVSSVLERLGLPVFAADRLAALRVEALEVAWPDDLDAKTFPHEAGLRDAVLAFDKGCYVGQEIINRMDTFAKVRRGLVRLVIDAEGPPPAGAEIHADGKVVGRLTSPARSGRYGVCGLAILREPHHAVGSRVRVVAGEAGWDATVEGSTRGG